MSWQDYFDACDTEDFNQVFDAMVGIGLRPVPITIEKDTQKIKIPYGKAWGQVSIDERKRKLNENINNNKPVGLGCQADGYVILDIDSPDKDVSRLPTAWKEAATLLLGGEDWPSTLIIKTQGGCHVWFQTTDQIKEIWQTQGKQELSLPSGGKVEFFTGNLAQMQVACPPSKGKVLSAKKIPTQMPKSVEQAIIDILQPPVKEVPPQPTMTERLRSDSENESWFLDRLFTLTGKTLNAPVNTRHSTYRGAVRTMAGYAAGLGLFHLQQQVWIQLSTAHKEAKPEVSSYVLTKTFEWAWEKGVSTPLYSPSIGLRNGAAAPQLSTEQLPTEYFEGLPEAANIDHILALMNERNWLWGDKDRNVGWFVDRGLHLVEGKEGTGKTRWILDLVKRWSLDQHWPDGTKTQMDPDSKVLFVASDSHWDQIATTAVSFGIPSSNVIFTGPENDPYNFTNIDDPQTLAMIRHWCGRYKIGMVVIDTLMAASSRPLVDPQEVAKISTPLRELAREFSIPIVLVGHLNSQGETWGRSMGRTCDNVIRLEADEMDEQSITIKSVKARWNRFELPVITARQHDTGWSYNAIGSDSKDDKQIKPRAAAEEAIRKYLVTFGKAAWGEIQAELQENGHTQSTVNRALKTMVSTSKLITWDEKYPSGKSCSFYQLDPKFEVDPES
jgi:hypothetical protein